jgi:hypothetical protein
MLPDHLRACFASASFVLVAPMMSHLRGGRWHFCMSLLGCKVGIDASIARHDDDDDKDNDGHSICPIPAAGDAHYTASPFAMGQASKRHVLLQLKSVYCLVGEEKGRKC